MKYLLDMPRFSALLNLCNQLGCLEKKEFQLLSKNQIISMRKLLKTLLHLGRIFT